MGICVGAKVHHTVCLREMQGGVSPPNSTWRGLPLPHRPQPRLIQGHLPFGSSERSEGCMGAGVGGRDLVALGSF